MEFQVSVQQYTTICVWGKAGQSTCSHSPLSRSKKPDWLKLHSNGIAGEMTKLELNKECFEEYCCLREAKWAKKKKAVTIQNLKFKSLNVCIALNSVWSIQWTTGWEVVDTVLRDRYRQGSTISFCLNWSFCTECRHFNATFTAAADPQSLHSHPHGC